MTQYKRKAEEAARAILEAFKAGDVPRAIAPVFINRNDEDLPCNKWSWGNRLLAAIYGDGDARGYRQWEAVDRYVKKGAKSFPILVPCVGTRTERNEETGEESKRQYVYGFTSAPVFGVLQTEGEPLPDPDPEATAWLETLPLRDVAESWGLSVAAFSGEGSRYLGYYRHGAGIALGVENLATWAHELVHAADSQAGTITKLPGQQPDNEVVAELGAAILLEILGYRVESDRGGCWDYLKTYAEKAKLEPMTACYRLLNRTCNAVALILDTGEEIAQNTETAKAVA